MPSGPSLGLQAVILCGSGTNLYPFTQTTDMPKALLPLGNRPMIYYPIDWCEKAGISSILILTLQEHLQQIQSHFKSPAFTGTALSNWLSKRNATLQIEAPSSLNDNLQSADILRVANKKGWIKNDFLVLPCDVVIQGLTVQDIAGVWMVEQGAFGGGNIGERKGRKKEDGRDGRRGPLGVWYGVEGEGSVKGQETDLIVLSPPSKRPLPLTTTACTIHTLLQSVPPHILKGITTSGDFPLRKTLLQRNPDLRIKSSSYRDSHIYIFPHWILAFIEANPRLSSIKDDVMPWLAKCGWQKGLGEKLGLGDILDPSRPASGGREAEESDEEDDCDIVGRSTTRVSALKYTLRKESQSFGHQRIESKLASRIEQKRASPSAANTGTSSPSEGGGAPTPQSMSISLHSIVSGSNESNPIPLMNRIPKITALVTPPEYQPNTDVPYIRRVDTPQLYLAANLHLAKSETALPGQHATSTNTASTGGSASGIPAVFQAGTPGTPGSGPGGFFAGEQQQVKIDPTCTIAQKCTITQADSLLGANVNVEEKVIIKRCVIGSNCVIAKGARLMACVLLDGVVIEENVKLDGCILGRNSRVGKSAVLKDCEVGHGYHVEEELEAKNERLVGLEGIDEDGEGEQWSEHEEDDKEEEEGGEEEEEKENMKEQNKKVKEQVKFDEEYNEDEDSDYRPGESEDEETEESDDDDEDDEDLGDLASGDEELIRAASSGSDKKLTFPAPANDNATSPSVISPVQIPLADKRLTFPAPGNDNATSPSVISPVQIPLPITGYDKRLTFPAPGNDNVTSPSVINPVQIPLPASPQSAETPNQGTTLPASQSAAQQTGESPKKESEQIKPVTAPLAPESQPTLVTTPGKAIDSTLA